MKRQEKGITLVALIVSIIIIVILAAVTIASFMDTHIIDIATNGAIDYALAEKKEKEEFEKIDNFIGDSLNRIQGEGGGSQGGDTPTIIQGAIEFGDLSWNSGKASVTITKTTTDDYKIEYKITNSSGTVKDYTEITSGGTVSNLNLGDTVTARLTDGENHGNSASITVADKNGPIVTVTRGTVTTNSITVTVSSTDNQAGMPSVVTYKYYIKKGTDASYPKEAKYMMTDTSATFENLTQNESYDIKVTTEDVVGNIGTGEITGITTGTIPNAGGDEIQTGAIEFGDLSWNSKKASVTITKTTTDDYKIEYKVTNSSGTIKDYTEITSGGAVSNLNLGDTVTARLTDGTNHGNSASITVADKDAPTAGITAGTSTLDTIPVTATGTDLESGIESYTFEYKLSTDESYTPATTITTSNATCNYTFEGLTPGQTYNLKVTVKDNAKNPKEAETTGTTLTPAPSLPDGWDGDKVDPVKSSDNVVVPVPKGFVASKASGENTVGNGFVIYQGSKDVTDSNKDSAMTTRNQFVWVPVADTSSMFWTYDGKDVGQLYEFALTKRTYSKITTFETSGYREPDVIVYGGSAYDAAPKNYLGLGLKNRAGEVVTTADQFKELIEEDFADMKASIEKYHGFYIGRYETGEGEKVVKGVDPLGDKTWYEQYKINKNMINANGIKSNMIWASQWDQTMIWFDSQGGEKKNYVYDSTGKGNYSGSSGSGGSLTTTGSNPAYAVNNIYDMAGNAEERTLAALQSGNRVTRGRYLLWSYRQKPPSLLRFRGVSDEVSA